MRIVNFFLLLLSFFLFNQIYAQKYSVFRQGKSYLGASAGMNFTQPVIVKRYSVIESLESPSEDLQEKKYDRMFKNMGFQFGLYYSYNFTRKISFNIQPGIASYRYHYMTNYQLTDTISSSVFEREMYHAQRISYLTIPVLIRYDIRASQFAPFIQAGLYTDFRLKAYKTIYYDNKIDQKVVKENNTSTGVDFSEQVFKNNIGLIAGGGFSFFTKHFALNLEINYRYGFRPIIRNDNRFADITGLTAQYLDVLDQHQLSNLSLQLTLMFPIDNSLSLNILRRTKYYK